MRTHHSIQLMISLSLIFSILSGLSLSACTVTVGNAKITTATITPSDPPEEKITPTDTLAPSAPTRTPAPTATNPPPGTVINISGTIQSVTVNNNITTIVINNVTYQVPQAILVVILSHLKAGVPIVFTASANPAHIMVVVNVVKIDNVTIIINEKNKGGDDENDDEGD